jgi:hypothetical protein
MKLPKLFTHKPDIGGTSIIDCNGNLVALSVSEMDINSEKQAAEIAKRCNAYDELVAYLKCYRSEVNKPLIDVVGGINRLLEELGEDSK